MNKIKGFLADRNLDARGLKMRVAHMLMFFIRDLVNTEALMVVNNFKDTVLAERISMLRDAIDEAVNLSEDQLDEIVEDVTTHIERGMTLEDLLEKVVGSALEEFTSDRDFRWAVENVMSDIDMQPIVENALTYIDDDDIIDTKSLVDNVADAVIDIIKEKLDK